MKFHIAVTVLSLLSSVSGDVNKDTSDVSSPLSPNAEAKLKHRNGQNQPNRRQQRQQVPSRNNRSQLDTTIDVDSLKNCDPDLGILSCAEKEYCINKTQLGMEGSGGLCIPIIDEDLDHTIMNQNQRKLQDDPPFLATCGQCADFQCTDYFYDVDRTCYCSCFADCYYYNICCSDHSTACPTEFEPTCGECSFADCGLLIVPEVSEGCFCSCFSTCENNEICCEGFDPDVTCTTPAPSPPPTTLAPTPAPTTAAPTTLAPTRAPTTAAPTTPVAPKKAKAPKAPKASKDSNIFEMTPKKAKSPKG